MPAYLHVLGEGWIRSKASLGSGGEVESVRNFSNSYPGIRIKLALLIDSLKLFTSVALFFIIVL